MRTVYVGSVLITRCKGFARCHEVHAVTASALIKELVLGLFDERRAFAMRSAMVRLLLDALGEAECLPTHLPMPTSEPLRKAASALLRSRRWQLPLREVAAKASMSERSFSRHFTADVGASFRAWRQRARIIASLDLLASQQSVKQIAHALHFASSAAYISAFRELMGCTPNAFREGGSTGR